MESIWFHTEEQISFLDNWMKKSINIDNPTQLAVQLNRFLKNI